jgi:lysophospholipase L1-like esterase
MEHSLMNTMFIFLFTSKLTLFSSLYASSVQQKTIVVTAIGDSISTGFNAKNIGDNRELSWGSGCSLEVDSHLKKLKLMGYSVHGHNNAKAGATIIDLKSQIDSVISNQADYVTMTLGANDVCGWPTKYQEKLTEFEEKLEFEISRAIQLNPKISFIISPVPNLHNLWEIGRNHGQCQSRWDFFKICSPLLNSRRTEEERNAFLSRWNDINNAIKNVASRLSENVVIAEDVLNTRFEISHISEIDCFHPSIVGQNLLANVTWTPFETLMWQLAENEP